MHVVEKGLGVDGVVFHQAAQSRSVGVEIHLLQRPRLLNLQVEGLGDKVAHAQIDLAEQVGGRRIKRVVEVKHPGFGLAQGGRGGARKRG